jgi:hypothetical protein
MALNLKSMLVATCIGLAAGTAYAHHSTANYNFEVSARQTITGTVTYWSFSNPHSFIDVDVRGEDGAVTPYKIFLTSRVVLQRYGWRPNSLNPGDEVEIEGSPDRQLPTELYLQRIRFPDGTQWRRDEVTE